MNLYQALAALRTALKKERGNPRLYSQIIDMCYQRSPIDVNGKPQCFGSGGLKEKTIFFSSFMTFQMILSNLKEKKSIFLKFLE